MICCKQYELKQYVFKSSVEKVLNYTHNIISPKQTQIYANKDKYYWIIGLQILYFSSIFLI